MLNKLTVLHSTQYNGMHPSNLIQDVQDPTGSQVVKFGFSKQISYTGASSLATFTIKEKVVPPKVLKKEVQKTSQQFAKVLGVKKLTPKQTADIHDRVKLQLLLKAFVQETDIQVVTIVRDGESVHCIESVSKSHIGLICDVLQVKPSVAFQSVLEQVTRGESFVHDHPNQLMVGSSATCVSVIKEDKQTLTFKNFNLEDDIFLNSLINFTLKIASLELVAVVGEGEIDIALNDKGQLSRLKFPKSSGYRKFTDTMSNSRIVDIATGNLVLFENDIMSIFKLLGEGWFE